MIEQLGPGLRITLIFTLLTGLLYPGLVTGLCQVLFPHQANGSMVESSDGKTAGSSLIGQSFTRPEYFHSRPSAAGDKGYDATASGGSNFGPTSQKLIDRIKTSTADFRKETPGFSGNIPADAVTASASGLDPDISPASAEAQVTRVAGVRSVAPEEILRLIRENTAERGLGILGEPAVNVLMLNLALDRQFPRK